MVAITQLKSPRGSAGIIIPNTEVSQFLQNYPWYLLGSKWGQSDVNDMAQDDDDDAAVDDDPVVINFLDGYNVGNFKPKIYILDNQIVMFWVPKPNSETAVLRDPDKGTGRWDPNRYTKDNIIRYDRQWSQGAGTWWFFHRSAKKVTDSTGKEYNPLVPGIPVKVTKFNNNEVDYEGVLETWTGAQLFRRSLSQSTIDWAAPQGFDFSMGGQGSRILGSAGYPKFKQWNFNLGTTFPTFSTWANTPTPKGRELKYNSVALQFWGAEIKQEKKTLQNITSFMDGQTIEFKLPLGYSQSLANSYITGKNPSSGQRINGRVNQLENWEDIIKMSFKNLTDMATEQPPEFTPQEFESGLTNHQGSNSNRNYKTFSADVKFNSEGALPIFQGSPQNPVHTSPWAGRGSIGDEFGFLINFVNLAPRLFRQ